MFFKLKYCLKIQRYFLYHLINCISFIFQLMFSFDFYYLLTNYSIYHKNEDFYTQPNYYKNTQPKYL
jgi:hypothetical protein